METHTSTYNGVRCALSRRRLIIPLVFKTTDNSKEGQYITTQFVSMLEEDKRYFLLQQRGATCYTMDFFKDYFDSRLISKHL